MVEIGSGAFYECTSLSAVEIESIDAWCGIKLDNATSNPAYYSHALTLGGSVITSLVIPEGVSEIGDFTFSYNTALRSVSIPSSVTSIGKFEDCTSLCEIVYNAKNANKALRANPPVFMRFFIIQAWFVLSEIGFYNQFTLLTMPEKRTAP